MIHARSATLVLAAGLAGAWLLGATAFAADPPKAYLPGLTAPDEAPQGCVSCHKGSRNLKVMLDALDHRDMGDKIKVVPDDCKSCHEDDDELEALGPVSHSMHYARGSKSDFVVKHGGSCLNCHALSTGTGEVTTKSGPTNW
ncbi:MAG: hypothetical protein MUC71_07190 [Steroidobacteraceae bacterium]|nr:hypothetical protein [Steroidobacteraceae bacterium]